MPPDPISNIDVGYIASATKANFVNPSTSIFPTALTQSEFVCISKKTNYNDYKGVIFKKLSFFLS